MDHSSTAKPEPMPQSLISCTVYFDGACPLCSREIATYQKQRGSDTIDWVDASSCTADVLGAGLDRGTAMAKLNVRDANGKLISGAAAFLFIWRQLPAFAWLVPLLSNRVMLPILNFCYDIFLKIRPVWRSRST